MIMSYTNGYPTGVVRYIKMLIEGLAEESGVKVHFIVLDTTILFPEIGKENGKVMAKIPFVTNFRPLQKELYWQTKYFSVITGLLLPHFEGMGQLIWHVNELFLSELANQLKSAVGGKVLVHLHIIPWKFSLESNERLFNKLYAESLNGVFDGINQNTVEQQAYALADKIVCVSISARQHIVSAYHIAPCKILVIPNGLINSCTPKHSRTKCCNILFVGRVSKEKGIIGLLNALMKVKNKGWTFNLKLVGYCSDEMLSKIYATYHQLSVEILGAISFEELCELYVTCTMGIIPSLHEQCSYVAIEMSMFGLPLIVSDVDALSEMFHDGVDALKVPLIFDSDFGLEVDEDRLADSVIRLLEDDQLKKKLSDNGIKNYYDRFTLKQMMEKTMNLYQLLIG